MKREADNTDDTFEEDVEEGIDETYGAPKVASEELQDNGQVKMDVEQRNRVSFLDDSELYKSEVKVCYPSSKHAQIALDALIVDRELQPDKVDKFFAVQGADLVVVFQATEARVLRVAMSSFFDMLTVVTRTLQEFDS